MYSPLQESQIAGLFDAIACMCTKTYPCGLLPVRISPCAAAYLFESRYVVFAAGQQVTQRTYAVDPGSPHVLVALQVLQQKNEIYGLRFGFLAVPMCA